MPQVELLADFPGPRPWTAGSSDAQDHSPANYFTGKGRSPLEVAITRMQRPPAEGRVREIWKARHAGKPSPLLLVVLYPARGSARAAVCGPVGDVPPVRLNLDPGQVERLAELALEEVDRHAAVRLLTDSFAHVEADLPGIRNVGMFATHELKEGVPRRADWAQKSQEGRSLLGKRGRQLVEGLGFEVETRGVATQVLRIREGRKAVAVAVFLERNENADAPSARFHDASPVSYAFARADQENLDYVVLTQGPAIRVYSAKKHAGVGRRGRAETFLEANLALMRSDEAGYLPLLFSAPALADGGTFEEILAHSRDFAAELGARLRDRVYDEVVPRLAEAIGGAYAKARRRPLKDSDLPHVQEMAMRVLFRLLFISYAEDKGLLPYETSGEYRRHALKTHARAFADRANEGGELTFDEGATDLWSEIQQLFLAVDKGNTDWGIPQYNGGLFGSDPKRYPIGADIARLKLTNAQFGPALFSLLVDRVADDDVVGPVDFRALTVREFGTIYEGLLESSLSLASTDLVLDKEGRYIPAKRGETPVVSEGTVYLQNQSGARKATGSYFTKQFAVEHLLETALDPAIDDHLEKVKALLDKGRQADAAKMFFDFRVADLAMGSGHFLVAAVDHIEAKFTTFLTEHPIPHVQAELQRLRAAAQTALGPLGEDLTIESASLLRRQIARRCIYGLDVNEIAVELARVGIWIHTFVQGLPLSFLNHNLVHGNSLTGIGTIEEAVEILDPEAADGGISLWSDVINSWMDEAQAALARMGLLADATTGEIEKAYAAQIEAQAKVEPARILFDMLVAHRLGEADLPDLTLGDVTDSPAARRAQRFVQPLMPVHFPVQFPEVFSGDQPGFHCIIGNPPWEEATVEAPKFWTRYEGGLMGLPQWEQQRRIDALRKANPELDTLYQAEVEASELVRRALVTGPYPGMGTGDPDLYKAFSWRFWDLLREGGRVGVVLPRSALMAKGSSHWRTSILQEGQYEDVTLLVNFRGWVFSEVMSRYTIGLVVMKKGEPNGPAVTLRGPFGDLEAFRDGIARKPARFSRDQFMSLSESAMFPLLPTPESGDIMERMLEHARFDSDDSAWRFRPVRELDATNDKKLMKFAASDTSSLWPVYKGASFNLWEPDTGEYYAWADPAKITKALQAKRLRQNRLARSAFSAFPRSWATDADTLPCYFARIAFRDVARATDKRTVIATLAPPRVTIANQAPYLLRIAGDAKDEAYLLGVLSSIPLDWYARRIVETHVNFHVLNGFPIPRPQERDPRRNRIVEISGRLAAVDDRYSSWAAEVGVPVGSVDGSHKPRLIAELDALVGHLYGLSEAQLVHMFETFDEGWDYSQRLEAVIEHYRAIES